MDAHFHEMSEMVIITTNSNPSAAMLLIAII